MQKLVYLIQEIGGVPAGYRYAFYTYGPYSRDLEGDLGIVQSLKGIAIIYDEGSNSFNISTGEFADRIIERGRDFLEAHGWQIKPVLARFGPRTAKELELTATIVFLQRNDREKNLNDEKLLIEKVAELKPKYGRDWIQSAIKELRDLGFAPQPA